MNADSTNVGVIIVQGEQGRMSGVLVGQGRNGASGVEEDGMDQRREYIVKL